MPELKTAVLEVYSMTLAVVREVLVAFVTVTVPRSTYQDVSEVMLSQVMSWAEVRLPLSAAVYRARTKASL